MTADPRQREDDPHLALRRAQRRLPPLRPRRLSSTSRHRRRQRHRRRPQTGQDISDLLALDPPHRRGQGRRGQGLRDPDRQPVRRTQGCPRPEIWAYGLRQRVEVSASTRRPATCGPARSGRICGSRSTRSRRAATTAGACRRAATRSAPNARRGRRRSCRRSSNTRTRSSARSPAASSTTAERLPELQGGLRLRRLRHRPGLDAPLRRQGKKVTEHRELARRPDPHRRLGAGRTTARCTRSTSSAAASTGWRRARRPPPKAPDVPPQAERDGPVRLDEGPDARRRG